MPGPYIHCEALLDRIRVLTDLEVGRNMKLVKGRFGTVALVASLTLIIGVLPCAASMMGGQSGHECCEPSFDPKSACELMCAISGSPFTVDQKPGFQKIETGPTTDVFVAAFQSVVNQPSSSSSAPLYPPGGSTPLFVLHAAFLV